MKIHYAKEGHEVDIPITEIIGDSGEIRILPQVKNYFSIDYKPKLNSLKLNTKNHIGLIPITTEIAIEIQPKFPIINLTRIVSISENRFKSLKLISRGYQEENNNSEIILEFVFESLVTQLEKILEEGILKEFIKKSETSSRIKGRIDIKESINKSWSKGFLHRASITYEDHTYQNSYNQLIKFTLDYCIIELQRISSKNNTLINDLIYFYSLFEDVDINDNENYYDLAAELSFHSNLPELRRYYYDISNTCRIIINKSGISFDENGSDLSMNSFTLNMPEIYEKYLINSLRENRSTISNDLIILDGNTEEGRKLFYNSPTDNKTVAKPDIILMKDNQCKIIADAKYKPSTKENDRYQILSHALCFGAKIAVLVLPGRKNNNEKLIYQGAVGVDTPIELYKYYFDLSSENLEQEEIIFAENLARLM